MEEIPAFVSKNNTYESQLLPNTLNPRGMTGREASTLVAHPWPARETQRQQQDPVVAQSGFGGGVVPAQDVVMPPTLETQSTIASHPM